MFIVTVMFGEMLDGYLKSQEDTDDADTPAAIVFTPDDDAHEWEDIRKKWNIELIKQTLPESQWPNEIKEDYEIEWKFDVANFLEYYSSFMSLAGMENAWCNRND